MAGPLVVGYDGTEGAKAALAEALRLAGALGVDIVVAFALLGRPARRRGRRPPRDAPRARARP